MIADARTHHLLLERRRKVAVQVKLELRGFAADAELVVKELVDVPQEQRRRAFSQNNTRFIIISQNAERHATLLSQQT